MRGQEIVPTAGRLSCDVVVVDDYRLLAEEIAKALSRRGLAALVAFDGAMALDLARRCNPAVALIDCGLPDIDGLQLVRQLGKAWPETTFLAISGDVGGVSEDAARELRIHAFLNRPLPMRALAQAVERLVDTSGDRIARKETPRTWVSLGIGSPAKRSPSLMLESLPLEG